MEGRRVRDFGEGESGIVAFAMPLICARCERPIIEEPPAHLGARDYHAECLLQTGRDLGRAERPVTQPNVFPGGTIVYPGTTISPISSPWAGGGGIAGGTNGITWLVDPNISGNTVMIASGSTTINGQPITISDHTHSVHSGT